MAGLFQELQRRNVFRVAVTYLVAAWVVAQVSGLAAGSFEAPAWIMQMIIVLLVIGFFPAVIFAWIFEFSPEGLRRERDLVDKQGVNAYTAKRLDLAVIVLLIAAISLLGADRFLFPSERTASTTATSTAVPSPAPAAWTLDSVAVLPFADSSPLRDQAWLGEGIAETLLHTLAQVEGLRVSARTSSFAYRERVADIATIGQELGVATVLEGSVQRAGDRLRVIAQLVRTDTQDQIFSKNFDRSADDIFAIQDEIAAAVAQALSGTRNPVVVELERTRTAVYDLYLDGRRLWQERNADAVNRAVELLRQAVAGDPDFGPAHAELATALLHQTNYTAATLDEHRAEIEGLIARALQINADDAQAWATRGLLLQALELSTEALKDLRRAESLSPGDANIQIWLGNSFLSRAELAAAARHYERALELDPLNVFVRGIYAQVLSGLDPQHPRVEAVARDSVRLFPDRPESWTALAEVLHILGRLDEMILTAFEGFQQHPDSGGPAFQIAVGLNQLGEHALADHWLGIATSLDEWLEVPSLYYLARRDPRLVLERAQPRLDGGDASELQAVILGLRLLGRVEEALQLATSLADDFDQRLARGELDGSAIGALIQGVIAARSVGRHDLADQWLQTVEQFVENLRAGGLREQDRFLDLILTSLRLDWDAAETHLLMLGPSAAHDAALTLSIDPWFAEFSERPAVQSFKAEQAQRLQDMLLRVRSQSSPELFDPHGRERSRAGPG